MFKQVVQWKYDFLDLVAPPKCVGCGVFGMLFCRYCVNRSQIVHPPFCKTCGNPSENVDLCKICSLYPPAFEQARSHFVYDMPFRNLIMKLKCQEMDLPNPIVIRWLLIDA